jgi:hypothetical protein
MRAASSRQRCKHRHGDSGAVLPARHVGAGDGIHRAKRLTWLLSLQELWTFKTDALAWSYDSLLD